MIKILLDHKRSPFIDDADLKSDLLAVNTLGTSLVVHDIRDTFSLSDYRKYFYINKSKLFDTNNTVNYFLPEDYKIYSKADRFLARNLSIHYIHLKKNHMFKIK